MFLSSSTVAFVIKEKLFIH